MKSYYVGPIGTYQRSFERYHLPPAASSSLRLGVRNPTQIFNRFPEHSHVHPNKSPLKISQKKVAWAYPETVHFLDRPYPLLSQKRVKLRTSNFVRTFIGSIGTNALKISGKLPVGVPRDSRKFSGHPYRPIGRIAWSSLR